MLKTFLLVLLSTIYLVESCAFDHKVVCNLCLAYGKRIDMIFLCKNIYMMYYCNDNQKDTENRTTNIQ